MGILFFIAVFFYALWAVWDTKKALLLLPLFFSTYLWKVEVMGIPMNFLEVVVDALFVIFLLRSLFFDRQTFFRFWNEQCSWKSPLVVWGLFVVLSILGLTDIPKQVLFPTGIPTSPIETFATMKIALGIIKTWMVPSWFFLVLGKYYLTHQEDSKKFMLSYVLGALLVSAASLFLKYGLHVQDTIDNRLGGIFVSANYLAFYVAPALLYVVTYFFEHPRKLFHDSLEKTYYFVLVGSLPFLCLALFFAKSYASFFAVLFCMSLYAFFRFSKKQKLTFLLVSFLLATVTLGFELGTKKFTTFFETRDQSSTSTRLEVYQVSLNLLKNNWVRGIGIGQYEAQYKMHAVEVLGKSPYEWVMLHPHNLYVSIWLSLGIFGLLLFLVMIWDSVRGFLKTKNWTFFLPFLYLLLHGLVDTPFWKMDMIFVVVMLYMLGTIFHLPTERKSVECVP